ncbi:unnamed protein product [Moneuplotes crassus]|uniref:Peptidase M14 domain-containing protein n=1 Tax=Euplotes crassus TaxID=5936 RepID=A0AAD1USZ5_EUPCR|nr:unnamed protein product [Moneuplotes crassus]
MKRTPENASSISLNTCSLQVSLEKEPQQKESKRNAPMPLAKRFQHSLEPDMLFGWKPKDGKNTKKESQKGLKKKTTKGLTKIHSQTISPIKIGASASRNNRMGPKPSHDLKHRSRREGTTSSVVSGRSGETQEVFQKLKKIPQTLAGLIEEIHLQHEGDLYKLRMQHPDIFLNSEISLPITKEMNGISDLSLDRSSNCEESLNRYQDPVFLMTVQNSFGSSKLCNKRASLDNSKRILEFSSNFESGNLHKAVKEEENEYGESIYKLWIRPDTNTAGHTQWFYFKAQYMSKNTKYTFKIQNFSKKHSAFQQGMSPSTFSTKDYRINHKLWTSDQTSEVEYFTNQEESARQNKKLYGLKFSYTSKFTDDEVYFAFSVPYSYSQLQHFLQNVVEESPLIKSNKISYEREELCQTLSGRKVDILKITNPSKKQTKKQSVVIMARCHPGETVGSFVMEGVLKGLLSHNFFSNYLRENCIFYIIPMFNPDGVFYGNNRTSLSGVDLNRRWSKPDQIMHPEVFYLKSLIHALGKEEVSIFIDLHGHSKKNNSFIYGNTYKRTLEKGNFWQVRFLSKLLSKIAPMFSYDCCSFSNQKSKSTTARAVIGKNIGILNCFTLESSFHAFKYFNMTNKCFVLCKYSINDYHEMGKYLCKGIYGTLRAFLSTEDCIEYNPNVDKTNTEVANNPFSVNALARKAQQEILDCSDLKAKLKLNLNRSIKLASKFKGLKSKPIHSKQVLSFLKQDSVTPKSIKSYRKQTMYKPKFKLKSQECQDISPRTSEDQLLLELGSTMKSQYLENLEKEVNTFMEESKLHEQPSNAFKIIDQDETIFKKENRSSDEDSNSEPSVDNLPEEELQQCYQQIKLTRENYIKKAKAKISIIKKKNSFPKIRDNSTISFPFSATPHVTSHKQRIFKEPKKVELYKFDQTLSERENTQLPQAISPRIPSSVTGLPVTLKNSNYSIKMCKYSAFKNKSLKKTNLNFKKENSSMYYAKIATKLPELSPRISSNFISKSNRSGELLNNMYKKRVPMSKNERYGATRSVAEISEEKRLQSYPYKNPPRSFGVRKLSNIIDNTQRYKILQDFIGKNL